LVSPGLFAFVPIGGSEAQADVDFIPTVPGVAPSRRLKLYKKAGDGISPCTIG
jgi:hypothetical protein